ncbi:MAG: ABC transporter ATP-binding protein/permease, partial [Acidimicrobiia bacterium]|nr:ABC transporter ATP-binding protein/permease [Acidimicrobiia bacterium]
HQGPMMNVRTHLKPERLAIGSEMVMQLLGTAAEAGFLLLVTRTGLALSVGDKTVGLYGDTTIEVSTALISAGVFVLVRFALGMTAAYSMSRSLGRVALRVRQVMIDAWLDASWPVKQRIAPGRVHQLLCNYSQTAATITSSATRFLAGAASLCVLLATAFAVQPWVTGFATIVVGLLGVLMRPLQTRVKHAVRGASNGLLAYSQTVAEAESMALEIEVLGVRDATSRWMKDAADEAVAGVRTAFLAQSSISPAYQFGAYSVIVALLTVGARFGVDDVGTIGAVLLLMLRSLSYGQSMQSQRGAFLSSQVYLDQLSHELKKWSADPAPIGTDTGVKATGVEARGLSFSYDGRDAALDAIDFDIRTGEVVGVVGPSGSGKSTLAELLLGLRSSGGQLRVDGVVVDEADRQWWSQHVSLVPQNHELLTGTVADNVRFLRPAISNQDVESACIAAGIHDEILSLPDGYDTHLGERGASLSGGQRQRICIARALAGQPRLLVMDEPTSALDAISEAAVLRSIADLRGKVTVVIVTHRPACLDVCDRVLALNNGRLEHFGLVADLRVAAIDGDARRGASRRPLHL